MLPINQNQYQSYQQAILKDPLLKYKTLAETLFKDRWGNPFKLTQGQAEIFRLIFERQILRATIRTITQYGKSEVASMAILSILCDRPEKILIVAPNTKQSEIIMNNVIQHLFDNPWITDQVDIKDYNSLERLKLERSKNRLTFKLGGEVFILTANVDEISKEGKALMGFGATIVMVDESSLIPDQIFSKILRMVGGVETGKLIQLGNPFEQNHFYRSFQSKRYQSIVIKQEQALAEGRVTQAFLDEAREEMTELEYKIFYECEFPEGGANDALIPMGWIEKAVNQDGVYTGDKQAGLDVARFGRDKSIYALRDGGNLMRLTQFDKMDTMQLTGWAAKFIDDDSPERTAVDVIGIGAGVVDRLAEMDYNVEGVNVGESCDYEEEKNRYMNKRAHYYFHLREQFRPDETTGKSMISIPDDPELKKQLAEIRYKISSDKRIKIEEKEEMKKRLGGLSPDKADALMLAFAPLTSSDAQLIIA